jgi:hypothetical protein
VTRLLSTEGLYSLDIPDDWRWEQTSEDGSLVLHWPAGHGLLRVAESLRSEEIANLLPDGRPIRVNGCEARFRETRHPDGGRVRQWVVGDRRTVVHVTHDLPPEGSLEESGRVDQIVASLALHRDPHPTVARLLERLHDDPDVRRGWTWRPLRPLVIACSSADMEVSLEPLVRAAAVNPAREATLIDREARRIRNLEIFSDRVPPLDHVEDALFPLIRSGVVQEAVDDRMRSVVATADMRPRLVCGEDLARRLFAPGLYVYLGVDVPGAFHFVTPAVQARWGVSVAELERRALVNLERKSAGDRVDVMESEGHRLLVFEDGEGLAASRLLLPGFRQMLERRLGSRFRVALPAAGVLIAFSSAFDTWRDTLGEDVWDAYLHEPVPITEQIYEHGGEALFVPVGV